MPRPCGNTNELGRIVLGLARSGLGGKLVLRVAAERLGKDFQNGAGGIHVDSVPSDEQTSLTSSRDLRGQREAWKPGYAKERKPSVRKREKEKLRFFSWPA